MTHQNSQHAYTALVTRDGHWWMIEVPKLEGYRTPDGGINMSTVTQARHEGEIELMAREFISTVTDTPIDDIAINIAE